MYLLLRGFPDFSAIETIMKNQQCSENAILHEKGNTAMKHIEALNHVLNSH